MSTTHPSIVHVIQVGEDGGPDITLYATRDLAEVAWQRLFLELGPNYDENDTPLTAPPALTDEGATIRNKWGSVKYTVEPLHVSVDSQLRPGARVSWMRTLGGGGGSGHRKNAKEARPAIVQRVGSKRVLIRDLSWIATPTFVGANGVTLATQTANRLTWVRPENISLTPHRKVLHGKCRVCGYFGADCTGESK